MKVRIIEPIKPPEPKLKRVCAYARVSVTNEAMEGSLENQTTYYKNLIEFNPEYEFVGVFADYAITGTKEARPEFQRMLTYAREQKIDLILTKSVSRFARNTVILLEIVRELKELGVEVWFERENISTFSGDGELLLSVLSSLAQEESMNTSENLKWRYKRKFEKGEVAINATRFLGYDKDENGELIINPGQAEIVERIFTDYISGKGSFVIAKELNDEGILTVAGGEWHSSTVLYILKNEKYKGSVLLQKTFSKDHLTKKKCFNHGELDSYYIEGNHEPIVSKEVWDEAQRLITLSGESKGNRKETGKYQKRYPLTGMLFCCHCGGVLRRRVWNSKLACRKIVWQCTTYIKKGKSACPGTVIDDAIVSKVTIKNKTVVTGVTRNGQKYFRYTGKSESNQFSGKCNTN